jgi:putative phosphoesterase
MDIVLISDTHGNFVALNTVLEQLRHEPIDQIVFLGDAVALGPQPREVLSALRNLNCCCVLGNTDDWLLDPQPETAADEATLRLLDLFAWCREQLSSSDTEFMRTFAATQEIALDERMSLLCFHGSPASCRDVILATTPEADLDRMLASAPARLFVGGHTHVQLLRAHREVTIINPGSIGAPAVLRDGRRFHPARAEYAMLHWQSGEYHAEFRRVPLRLDRVWQAARDSGMPHAEWWCSEWIEE